MIPTAAGAFLGKKIHEKYGLILIISIDVFIVSTATYMFLISFTGLWEMIINIVCAMSFSCTYLTLKPMFHD